MNSFFYICNNFTGNKVHSETIFKISRKYNNANHYVFVPCSSKKLLGKNFIKTDNVFIEYIYINKFFRFLPLLKSFLIFICILIKSKKYNIKWKEGKCLAYTFWSDGIISLYLNLIFKTPFSVFLRVTDTSVFFKYGFYLRPFFYLISKRTSFIFFPSKVLEENFLKYNFISKDKEKNFFLPNSINEFWLENVYHYDNLEIKNKKILFVGSFDKNKNLPTVLNACSILYANRQDFSLVFIGGSLSDFKKICKISEIPNWVCVVDKLKKDELLYKYRQSNIMIVPSFLETFGMVYLEAISQGCFVVHSKNQGIDYIFNNGFSYSVDPNDEIRVFNILNELLDKDFKMQSSELKNNLDFFSSRKLIDLYSIFFN